MKLNLAYNVELKTVLNFYNLSTKTIANKSEFKKVQKISK